MGATASLTPTDVTVEPGTTATCQIRVRNTGQVVDQFTFSVLGQMQTMATIEPPQVSLLPGTEGVATVLFSAARSPAVAAGTYAFAVKVSSSEDPEGSVTEEGTLTVGVLLDIFVEVLPRTTRGRRGARAEVAVDNRGNQRVNGDLATVDPTNSLRFRFAAPAVIAEPNTATFSKLAISPVKSFWKGPEKSHPFKVALSTPGGLTVLADGIFLQEALVPRWLLKALLIALALLVILAVLWFTLLRPTIKSEATSAAQNAIAAPLASQAAKTAALGTAQQAAAQTAAQQGAAVQQLQKAVGITPTASSSLPPIGGTGTGTSPGSTSSSATGVYGRLSASVAPGANSPTVSYTVPTGNTLDITDLILENPAGDSGTLVLEQGSTPMLSVSLDNFRDLDYHFVTAPSLTSGQTLVLAVTCANVANGATAAKTCTPGVFYSGTLTPSPSPTPTG